MKNSFFSPRQVDRKQYEARFKIEYGQEPMPKTSPTHDFCWASYKAGQESMRQQLDEKSAIITRQLCELDELRQQLAKRDRYPIAWMTTDEEGSPAMLFFDKQEALMFSGDDEPVPLLQGSSMTKRQEDTE